MNDDFNSPVLIAPIRRGADYQLLSDKTASIGKEDSETLATDEYLCIRCIGVADETKAVLEAMGVTHRG